MIDSIIEINNFEKRWRNSKRQLHRENGPAIISTRKDRYYCYWRLNGKYHRIDGPAHVYSDGYKSWWLEDRCIRKFEYD